MNDHDLNDAVYKAGMHLDSLNLADRHYADVRKHYNVLAKLQRIRCVHKTIQQPTVDPQTVKALEDQVSLLRARTNAHAKEIRRLIIQTGGEDL